MRYEDVVRLQVAMNDAVLMQKHETLQNLLQHSLDEQEPFP